MQKKFTKCNKSVKWIWACLVCIMSLIPRDMYQWWPFEYCNAFWALQICQMGFSFLISMALTSCMNTVPRSFLYMVKCTYSAKTVISSASAIKPPLFKKWPLLFVCTFCVYYFSSSKLNPPLQAIAVVSECGLKCWCGFGLLFWVLC